MRPRAELPDAWVAAAPSLAPVTHVLSKARAGLRGLPTVSAWISDPGGDDLSAFPLLLLQPLCCVPALLLTSPPPLPSRGTPGDL